MNHQYLDILTHRLRKFEEGCDEFTCGYVLRKLHNLIARLYEGDGSDKDDIRAVSALLNDDWPNSVWLDASGHFVSFFDRSDLIGVIRESENTYWDRWREGKLLPANDWNGVAYEPRGKQDGVSMMGYQHRQGRKRSAYKWVTEPRSYDDWSVRISKCWKDQSKRRHQYRPIAA